MIKRIFLIFVISLFFQGCENPEMELDISSITTKSKFKRFDSAFFTLDTTHFTSQLETLKKEYPPFFMSGEIERFWKYQRVDARQNLLFKTSQEEFKDFSKYQNALNLGMKHFYAAFPNHDVIDFYSYISNLDFNSPVFYNDSLNTCFIALDLYLGQHKEFYAFLPEYIAFERQKAFLIRDALGSIVSTKIEVPSPESILLEDMIYFGKFLFILEKLMPDAPDWGIIKYPKEKFLFCNENEKHIWAYFVENKLLYSTKARDKKRFIDTSPFTKFGMKFDNQSPGRIGQWLGWQIVKKYMQKNPGKTIEDLLKEKNPQTILNSSSYRPE